MKPLIYGLTIWITCIDNYASIKCRELNLDRVSAVAYQKGKEKTVQFFNDDYKTILYCRRDNLKEGRKCKQFMDVNY